MLKELRFKPNSASPQTHPLIMLSLSLQSSCVQTSCPQELHLVTLKGADSQPHLHKCGFSIWNQAWGFAFKLAPCWLPREHFENNCCSLVSHPVLMGLYPRVSTFPFLSRDSDSSSRQVTDQAFGGNPFWGEAEVYEIASCNAKQLSV